MTPAPRPLTSEEMKLLKLRSLQESLVRHLRIKNNTKDSIKGGWKYTDENIEDIADLLQIQLLREELNNEPFSLRLPFLVSRLSDKTLTPKETDELVDIVIEMQGLLLFPESEGGK